MSDFYPKPWREPTWAHYGEMVGNDVDKAGKKINALAADIMEFLREKGADTRYAAAALGIAFGTVQAGGIASGIPGIQGMTDMAKSEALAHALLKHMTSDDGGEQD